MKSYSDAREETKHRLVMVSFKRLSSAATTEAPASLSACHPPLWLAEAAVAPPGTTLPPSLSERVVSPGQDSPSSSVGTRAAQAASENFLHRLLYDLGPTVTAPESMASLKAALLPFGRPQESSVARAILVMAATNGGTASAAGVTGEAGASRVEVPTIFQMFRLFGTPENDAISPPLQQQQLPAVDAADWNPDTLVRVVVELANGCGKPLDWPAVARGFDVAELPTVLNVHSLRTILLAYGVATGRPVLPGESLVGRWTHSASQLAMLNCVLTLPGSVNWKSVKPAVDSTAEDAASPFRCVPLIEALVELDARNLLQAAVTASPDLVLLSLAKSSPRTNGAIRHALLVPLLSSRLAAFPSTSGIVKQMWTISRPVVEVGLQRLWQAEGGGIGVVLDIIQCLDALPEFLSSSNNFPPKFTLDLALAAFSRDLLNLEEWLTGRLSEGGVPFAGACILYLSESISSPGCVAQAMSLDAAALLLKCLFNIASHGELAGELRRIYDAYVALNPRLADLSAPWGSSGSKEKVGLGGNSTDASDALQSSADNAEGFPPDVDAEADKHYKRLYQEDMTVEQTVELLQQLCASPVEHNQQVYRCMIHTLFDEYRFLRKYPDRELRITGMLFGALAQFSVLKGKELGVLLNHVLEALSSIEAEPIPIGRLPKFGICALERFRARLPEFPYFCDRVLSISRLHTVIPELLAEVAVGRRAGSGGGRSVVPSDLEMEIGAPWVPEGAPAIANPAGAVDSVVGGHGSAVSTMSYNQMTSSTGTVVGPEVLLTKSGVSNSVKVEGTEISPASTRTTPLKSGLRPSPSGDGTLQFSTVNMETLLAQQQSMEVPDSSTQDKIHFIFNNLSATNMGIKEDELMEFLDERYVDFLAHYVVVKRASIEPNFHALYITFLTRIAKHIPKLFSKVFDKSFVNVRLLLGSGKIVSSSSERLLLKSLGSWIGALTLGRNKPLLRKELDIKKLLLDAYSNGRLIAVVPFVSKLLVMSKGSLVFKPTNPWLAAILRLLREIYLVPDLKLNVKFELPLLTKELGIDANEIEPANLLCSRPAPVRDGNPDFTAIKKQSGIASPVRSASPNSSPVRSIGRENSRGEPFNLSDPANADGPAARGAGGVPIFSLGGNPSTSVGSAGNSMTELGNIAAVMTGTGSASGGVRANVPGSETVADLATIMASASLSSSAQQHQHSASMQRYGNLGVAATGRGTGGQGAAAAAAAVAAAAQQAAAVAAASDVQMAPLVQPILINQSLVLFQTAPHLKSFISPAIDRAVQEIITPVVERSCAIATITTKELAMKDFANEMDPMKIQRAAKQMVQQLAGSLALVTCKEPLRVSMGNQLRPALSAAASGDSNLLEQTIQVLCTANLEAGCSVIEQAATEKAARDINEVIAPLFSARRQQQQRQGTSLITPSAFQDVLRVYDDFTRLPRSTAGSVVAASVAPAPVPNQGPPGYQTTLATPLNQATSLPGSNSGAMDPSAVGVSSGMMPQNSAIAGSGNAPSALNSSSAMKYNSLSLAANGVEDSLGSGLQSGAGRGGRYSAISAPGAMASPAEMAEAMRYATANAPSLATSQSTASASVLASAGEGKLSTQQVLELFNTVYPQLTGAISNAVKTVVPAKPVADGGLETVDALYQVDLPADHSVHRLRTQIAQAVKRSLTADEASMAVAQKVFKRLYEGNSNLYRDVHVSLLESMRECSRRLSKELVSWLAYSEDSKKLNRECAVALLRPGSLLHITSYDELVAKTCDNGRNSAAMEFAAFLVQRVIVEEPLTTTRELYLTLEVLAKVGRRSPSTTYPAAPDGLVALVEACRDVVHRPAPSPSLSNAGFNTIGSVASIGSAGIASGNAEDHVAAAARAAKATSEAETIDPPQSREMVASVLMEWQRVLEGTRSQAVPDRVIASFVTQAKPTTMYNDEARDRFFRIGIDLVCFATSCALKSKTSRSRRDSSAAAIVSAPYTPVEAMVRLVAAVCKPETSGESAAKGVAMLASYLQALVRCIVKASHGGDVRPHFRLFIGVVMEVCRGMPAVDSGERSAGAALEQDGTSASGSTSESGIWNGLEPGLSGRSSDSLGGQANTENGSGTANFQILSTIASALNACNPNVAPAFAFSWLQIVSHHDVLPRLLSYRSGKGWRLLRQLIVSMLSFISPHLSKVGPQSDIPSQIRTLYRGTLRVLLVLLHDFPEFLCDYHFALCDVIPSSCIQMRNLVLSAYPRSMRLPDPFLPNLKVDKLEEMSSEPRVLSNLTTALVTAGVKAPVDKFLQDPKAQSASSLALHTKLVCRDKHGQKHNIPAVNALVLYLGQQSMSRNPPGSQPVVNGPSIEVMQALLVDMDAEGRFHLLNAIANQLRYPNLHTHYFSCVLLYLFKDGSSVTVKEQITRVLVERLIANRPHPWGLLITFIELIKNAEYGFWNHEFVRCAPQIEQLFENVVRFALSSSGVAAGSEPGPNTKGQQAPTSTG